MSKRPYVVILVLVVVAVIVILGAPALWHAFLRMHGMH
jgi:hypothetical protein